MIGWVMRLYCRHLRQRAAEEEQKAILCLEDATEYDTKADRIEARLPAEE